MKLDENQEAINLLNNTKGSIENRMRSLYNLGYWQGFNDGQREAVRMLEQTLLDMADRKTENSSEKPNNATISKMEQVQAMDSYSYARGFADGRESMRNLFEQTEPQTDCGDFADRLAYERGVKHAWEVAQKVFDSTVTFYEAEDVAKQIDKMAIGKRSDATADKYNLYGKTTTDEPQTEREGE